MTDFQAETKVAIVDIDAVCADLHHSWLTRYNTEWKDTLTREQITNWDMTRFVKPECGKAIFTYINDPTLYDDTPVMEGALDGVSRIRQLGFRVIFCTSSPVGAMGRKLVWLRAHGFLESKGGADQSPHPDYIEATDKSVIRGHVIIDDYIETLKKFPGVPIAFAQPWNSEAEELGIRRAHGWQDVLRHMKEIENSWTTTKPRQSGRRPFLKT